MVDIKQPLVSVPVGTYNSSKTVIETLDSVYAQTYPNIELIVSDDCSTDNTVELVQEWLDSHKQRFVRTEIITVERNTGVSGNLNRAELACKGEWEKSIAGDDILLPTCIQDCIDYVLKHPDTTWLFGRARVFGASQEDIDRVESYFDYSFFSLAKDDQLHRLIFKGNCIPAPASFVNIKRNQELGIKNDERIPLLEDWPKWINLLRAGVKFHFIDKEIVKYRISSNALSTGQTTSELYQKNNEMVYIYYRFPASYKESTRKLDEIHRYVRAKKFVTGKWYWACINRLLKIIGNK